MSKHTHTPPVDGCNCGPYFVERNGRRISPKFDTEAEAARWARAHPAPQKVKGGTRKR